MCDTFLREIKEPCTEIVSADCKVAVARAVARHGVSCAQLPLFAHAPPLSAYVCPGAVPPALGPLCGGGTTRGGALPAGTPSASLAPKPAPGPVAITSGVVLAGLGLTGARRVHRLATRGELPGRIGRWVVHKVGDPQGVHVNDEYVHGVVKRKIMDPDATYEPRGIEGAVISQAEFENAKQKMAEEWYKVAYSSEQHRADQVLSHQSDYKLSHIVNDDVII